LHRQMGFITPVSVVSSTETTLVLRMKSVYEGELTFHFVVEAAEPHRLASLQVEAGGRGGE
jgi:hypothetical protein